MSQGLGRSNQVRVRRLERGWSQAELAQRAGISRAAVSAIEMSRLVPSVAAALALAQALECSVEELFAPSHAGLGEPRWAWPPASDPCRFWHATVGGQLLLFPVETTLAGQVEHDGVYRSGRILSSNRFAPEKTLVIACCDPAAGLLASAVHRLTGLRVIVLSRSSYQALALLGQGLVHAAGVHLATEESPNANSTIVRQRLGNRYQLLRVARWQEGLALSPACGVHSIRAALRAPLRWVGREPGSAARQCQDELLGQRQPPRRLARDHRGVAEAIRGGWSDVGVSLRLVSEEAQLQFIPVREEFYELCISSDSEPDRRVCALKEVLRSKYYRQMLADLPGYDVSDCGESYSVS